MRPRPCILIRGPATIGWLVLFSSALSAQEVVRGPYLQSATPTGIVVRWRTDQATSARVRYGFSPSALTLAADGESSATEHAVAIAGLASSTRYFYSIGTEAGALAGGDGDHHFTTSPPIGARQKIRIWAIGDSGRADAAAAAVRDAYTTFTLGAPADLWLMLGDNAYGDGTDAEYQAAVFDIYPELLRTTPLWPTLGNHDAHSTTTSLQAGPYYDIFSLPTQGEAGGVPSGTEAYYSFDFAGVHFVALDSQDSLTDSGDAMPIWLAADLAGADADWIVAFWHHPPYTKGTHDSDDPIDSEGRMQAMRADVLPILEAGGVDLVLAGHSHVYERSFLVDGHYGDSTTLTSSMILDGGDGRIGGSGAYMKPSSGQAPHQGTVYVVAGNGGRVAGGGGDLDHPVMATSLRVLGSIVIDVEGNRMDVRMIDDAGAVRDDFAIVKGLNSVDPIARWNRYR